MAMKKYSAFPQTSISTGASLSDWLMLYPGYSLGDSYPSAEMQLVYSTAQVDRAHWSFVYTQLNHQTVLFLTIRYNASHLFAHSLNVKQFYLTHREDPIWCNYYSRTRSNGSEGLLYIPQSSISTEVINQIVLCHIQNTR